MFTAVASGMASLEETDGPHTHMCKSVIAAVTRPRGPRHVMLFGRMPWVVQMHNMVERRLEKTS